MLPGGAAMEVGGRIARHVTGKSPEEMPTSGEYFMRSTGAGRGLGIAPMTSAAWFGVGGPLEEVSALP
jgi:hypothetical protein